ncbi:MAG: substrate-binding domain-containing protein [Lentisphaerae bacterium]|jgi:DNA-binding LacI/PurR family transcriptional regulator|nr:substrate-binding domain-containing protein [Lentisphaerota bacterium]
MDIDFSSHIPVYVQVKDQLQAEINARGLKSGDALPTLARICDMAGVSMRTAQRAVELMLKEGIGKRIGRQLVVGDTPLRVPDVKSIFIIASDFSLASYGSVGDLIMQGIREEVAKEPDSEVVFAAPDFVNSLQYYLNNPGMRVCGVLLLRCQHFDMIKNLVEQYPQVRFVQVNYYLDGIETLPENLYGVFNDDFAGGYMAAEYLLLQAGSRKPVVWERANLDQVYQERRRGFLAALRDHGTDGRVFLQQPYPETQDLFSDNYNFFATLYKQATDLDSVFCSNDLMAATASQYLEHIGKQSIPVIGYDNYIYQPFRKQSTVGIDFVRMGQVAVQRLRQKSGLRFTKLLPQLIIRKAQTPDALSSTKHVFQVFNMQSSAASDAESPLLKSSTTINCKKGQNHDAL